MLLVKVTAEVCFFPDICNVLLVSGEASSAVGYQLSMHAKCTISPLNLGMILF